MTDFPQVSLHTLLKKCTKPIIIGITGDSGSGKTTYSNGIRRILGTGLVKTIDMDGYHKENREERKSSGHLPLDPSLNRLDLLKEHLGRLKQGIAVQIPRYNHATGEFDTPVDFLPTPIIIVEGLHALYPEFLPFYDFTIYVDPSREVKWQWKYERDVNTRGHQISSLVSEMLKREALYKRYIDFQKTSAAVVVKILPSEIKKLARYEMINEIPPTCYKVEIIMEPSSSPLPPLPLFFDLASISDTDKEPFMLACVPSLYWGRKTVVIHIDGMLAEKTVKSLEEQIIRFTGISPDGALQLSPHEKVLATQFAQLVITWRFLELLTASLDPKSS